MGYKIGVDKQQLSLLPVSLDDYVPENHICRVITAFTEQLNLEALGYKYAECKKTGCRPYDPRMMLNLYLYGYLHRVRSSRRLRDEAVRNVEVMWLMEGLRPDDKTICNFRKDNAKALRETFREFVLMCREGELYGGEVIATDGTKFRANNALKNTHNEIVVKNELGRIEKRIRKYLEELEEADQEEEGESPPDTEKLKAALEKLRQRKANYEGLEKRVVAAGEVSTVDPDARLMRMGGDGRRLDSGYNVQTVVDGKHHIIVDFEVTNNSGDNGNLYKMAGRAKALLGVQTLVNLADKGYYDSDDLAACERNGITCLVAKPRQTGPAKAAAFAYRQFVYDRDKDRYVCPGNQHLEYRRTKKNFSGKECRVYVNYTACRTCLEKTECTNYRYREIHRLPHQDILGIVEERTRKNQELYRKRQAIVEHPFGTIKAVWGYKQFLCRTKVKVTAETALAYLAYNIRRVFTISMETGLQPVFE